MKASIQYFETWQNYKLQHATIISFLILLRASNYLQFNGVAV